MSNTTKTPGTVYACPRCKSCRVQSQYWVDENTREIAHETGGYSWCQKCEDDNENGEVKFEQLIEISYLDTPEADAGQPYPNTTPDVNGSLLNALYMALPYVEDAELAPGFKPGAVAKHLREIIAALRKADPNFRAA